MRIVIRARWIQRWRGTLYGERKAVVGGREKAHDAARARERGADEHAQRRTPSW